MFKKVFISIVIMALMLAMASLTVAAKGPGGGGEKPGGETAGNNLSYPVIWAEGVAKTLPGTAGADPVLTGEWWYQWGTNGTDPDITPASCLPDPDESDLELNPFGYHYCDDGVLGLSDPIDDPENNPKQADNPLPLAKAYIQKDPFNIWQADSGNWSGTGEEGANEPVNVHWIDWGDNLESVDWYTKSQVRTEVVLFQDLFLEGEDGYLNPTDTRAGIEPWLEYEMRHTSGWGIDEVHGLAATLGETPVAIEGLGTRATVYSHCARLTIQLLLVDRDASSLADLIWVPGEGWTEPENYPDDLINPHIFNGSVHEGGDGPGYYSAEINVKGRVIYGYTWNVRNMNEGPGDYRITFSFDQTCGTVELNTFFEDGTTQIMVPIEEEGEVAIEAEPVGGGATAVLVPAVYDVDGNLISGNLTYIDVRILERGGGGGGGKPSK